MNENVLGEHGRALEDSFFYKRNHDLLKKLREELDAQASREALLAACGVTDEAVLNQLVALGIHPETLTALCLVPLVQVAWADGSIDANERSAVLSVAQRQGLTKENVNYQLLQSGSKNSRTLNSWRSGKTTCGPFWKRSTPKHERC